MKIGYARVSTEEQNLDMQVRALTAAGCESIHTEKVSGAAKKRPKLDLAIKELRQGDTLVVWRLDRVARSMRQLFDRLDQIVEAGANLQSLTEHIDISTAIGRLFINIFGSFAEFERALTVERTKAGIEAAKARGQKFGRKRVLTPAKEKKVLALVKEGKLDNKQIAKQMKCSPSTIQNFLKAERKRLPRKYLFRRKT